MKHLEQILYGLIVGTFIVMIGAIILLSIYIRFQEERIQFKADTMVQMQKINDALMDSITEIARGHEKGM